MQFNVTALLILVQTAALLYLGYRMFLNEKRTHEQMYVLNNMADRVHQQPLPRYEQSRSSMLHMPQKSRMEIEEEKFLRENASQKTQHQPSPLQPTNPVIQELNARSKAGSAKESAPFAQAANQSGSSVTFSTGGSSDEFGFLDSQINRR